MLKTTLQRVQRLALWRRQGRRQGVFISCLEYTNQGTVLFDVRNGSTLEIVDGPLKRNINSNLQLARKLGGLGAVRLGDNLIEYSEFSVCGRAETNSMDMCKLNLKKRRHSLACFM